MIGHAGETPSTCASLAEVLAPQTIEHAAPVLRVAADVVVRVRLELGAGLIDPALRRAVAQFLPHRGRAPVLRLGRHVAATLDQEDALARRREGVGHRAAARAGPDDHEVEVRGCACGGSARLHRASPRPGALAMIWSIRRWSSMARSSRISGGVPVRMLRDEVTIHRLVAADVPHARAGSAAAGARGGARARSRRWTRT